MKILLVSWHFPPANAIGAVRVGKLAKFLVRRRHDVRVLAGRNNAVAQSLPLEIPEQFVTYTGLIDVNRPLHVLQNTFRRLTKTHASSGRADGQDRGGISSWLRSASDFYVNLVNQPDRYVGWLPAALVAARRGIFSRGWRPDIIIASGPPFTAFLVARALARKLHVPWLAELRDRWSDDPYNEYPDWKIRRVARLERRVLETAGGIITVSEPWADFYRAKFGKPVAVVYNGFDPEDFPLSDPCPCDRRDGELEIVYTGVIYSGRRDPSPLFHAIQMLGHDRGKVRVTFYGAAPDLVEPLARACRIEDRVSVRDAVPYRQVIEIQRRADVLLLLQWNDPKEQGNCPAKLFEYLAVLRPILGIGLDNGVPATIIRSQSAGLFANDPADIARQLRAWLRQKQGQGCIPPLPATVREGFSRDIQFAKLEEYCARFIHAPNAHARENPSIPG